MSDSLTSTTSISCFCSLPLISVFTILLAGCWFSIVPPRLVVSGLPGSRLPVKCPIPGRECTSLLPQIVRALRVYQGGTSSPLLPRVSVLDLDIYYKEERQ